MAAKTPNPKIGDQFGRLTVVGEVFRRGTNIVVPVQCSCGSLLNVYKANIARGATRSCGCLNSELVKARCQKYPDGSRDTYLVWHAMMDRCYRESNEHYINYGGRGIKVAKRWHDFLKFLEDMGNAPTGLTLERVDNNKGYSKSNCAWVPWSANAHNKRIWHRVEHLARL